MLLVQTGFRIDTAKIKNREMGTKKGRQPYGMVTAL